MSLLRREFGKFDGGTEELRGAAGALLIGVDGDESIGTAK